MRKLNLHCLVQFKSKISKKTVGIEEKLDVISWLDKDKRIIDKCHNVKLGHGSVYTIRDNADRIKESAKSGTKVFV